MPVNTGFAEESAGNDILSGDDGPGGAGKEDVSRKGFRDTGRSRGDMCPAERAGDTARFRNGLFDERLRFSPAGGDCRLSIKEKQGS